LAWVAGNSQYNQYYSELSDIALEVLALALGIALSAIFMRFFITAFISMFNHTILRFAVPAMRFVTSLLLVGYFFVGKQAVSTEQPTPIE